MPGDGAKVGVAVARIQTDMGNTKKAKITMHLYVLGCPFVRQGGVKGVNFDFDVSSVRNGGIRSNGVGGNGI